jgi:hypothetical protein
MMIEVIYDNRQTGKTTRLIDRAATEDLYIVCPTLHMAHSVYVMARRQNKIIHMPITWERFLRKEYYDKNIKGFLFDELGIALQMQTSVPIKAITISREG